MKVTPPNVHLLFYIFNRNFLLYVGDPTQCAPFINLFTFSIVIFIIWRWPHPTSSRLEEFTVRLENLCLKICSGSWRRRLRLAKIIMVVWKVSKIHLVDKHPSNLLQGVILVSFGSAVKPSQMTKERRAIFLEVFSQLGELLTISGRAKWSFSIIWKWADDWFVVVGKKRFSSH